AATRLIINLFVSGSTIFGKAFVDAWRQASIKAAQGAAGRMLSVQEAQKILGLRPQCEMKEVLQKYEKMFKANDPANGGSFYLQSKVVRAKEALEAEMAKVTRQA
ncbi:mitochondrial import inner membrane translocase subunit tim16, putative, partial [Acanthamoeba castellanii str. Neff]